MKIQYKKWKAVVVLFFYMCFPMLSVHAKEAEVLDAKVLPRALDQIKKADFTYDEGIRYLDRFTSKIWVPDSLFGFSAEMNYLINSFVQAIFWLNKFLFSVFGEIYKQLTGGTDTLFEDYITIALESAKAMYDGIAGTGLIPFLGSVMAGYAAYVFFVKNGDFVKTVLKCLLIYASTTLIFFQTSSGNYLVKEIYNNMNTVTSELVSKSIESVKAQNQKNSKASKLASVDNLAELKEYFNISVWQPYVAMNSEGDNDLTESQLLALLEYNSGDKRFEIDGTIIEEFVGEGKDVKHPRLSIAWAAKFSYAFGSLFDTVALGLILDAFAITGFMNKLLIIFLLLFSGLIAVVAMIPTFENVLFNFLKKLFSSVFLTSLVQLGSMIVLWIYSMLSLITSTLFSNILVAAIVKGIILWLIWKKRDNLMALLTAGRVTQIAGNLSRRFSGLRSPVRNIKRRGQLYGGNRRAISRRKRATPNLRKKMLREIGTGAVRLGAGALGAGLAAKFAPQLQAIEAGKQAISNGKLGQTGRNLLNMKDKVANKVDRVRAAGVNQKNDADTKRVIENSISRRKEKISRRQALNDRLNGKVSLNRQESPERLKYKKERLEKHQRKMERRKLRIKSYAAVQKQKEHNHATKQRLLKARAKRALYQEKPDMGQFEIKGKR